MAVQVKSSQALSALNLTPLIDVVFLLLVLFLVASRLSEEDRKLDVVLPSAGSAQPMTAEPREIIVSVDQAGKFFLDAKMVSEQELKRILERAVADNPAQQSVIIRGDRRAAFQYVVTIMDLCNQAGVTNYSVTTAEGS
jgi:biopolymer transport protein ExbD